MTLPHPNTIDSWKDDMKIWPDITLEKMVFYLMKSTAVDDVAQDAVKAGIFTAIKLASF